MTIKFLLLAFVAVSANTAPPRLLAATAFEMSEVSATYSGAQFTVSGKAELADDNLVANTNNSITIPVKVEPEAVSDVSITVTTKLSLVTADQCALTTKMSVEITCARCSWLCLRNSWMPWTWSAKVSLLRLPVRISRK